jgi:hypothetical protein
MVAIPPALRPQNALAATTPNQVEANALNTVPIVKILTATK